MVRVRAKRNLGETDFGNGHTEGWSGKLGGTDLLISVRPKCYEEEQRVCIVISVGLITQIR